MNYGFVPSKIDGTELEFKEIKSMELPNSYNYKKFLPKIINQGQKPICVPCSISAYINWSENIETGKNKNDNNVNLLDIYKHRTNEGDEGMSFKDALNYLRHNGVETDNGIYKINRYAKIGSIVPLKQALIANGPCVGGLPVYDSNRCDFWNKLYGEEFQGGHAISIVGYNEKGIIIRNSWGERFCDDGYVTMPYDEFNSFTEIWTMF